MNKQQLTLLAKRTIDQRRLNAEIKSEKVLQELRTHDDWRSCEQQLKKAQVQVNIFGDESAKSTVQKQKAIQAKLLEKYGYTNEDLRVHYSCPICNDTGYAGDAMCNCLQEELRKLLIKESNVVDKNCTFENSKETNKHNCAVYKKAQSVCENGDLKNMLLTGGTGTGKTYLLVACANKCLEHNQSVLFITAYNLSSLFLECHLSDISTKKTILENLLDVDVLIIDDLGTENIYRNVTAEYLFSLLNERITSHKQTFFSTNLALADIRERYDERIFSRLVDQSITFVAQLEGNDKRLSK